MFRFVVGHSEDAMQEAEMGREIAENGAFLRLPVQVAFLIVFPSMWPALNTVLTAIQF